MSTSDGYVSGLVKVHDGGSPADRFNLVLVAEGYQVGEIAQFQSDVNEFVTHLFNSPPFDEEDLACAFNIYRLEVISDESGADFPMCDDGEGDGSSVATYFDATFCADGKITRLMAGDSGSVQTTVESYLPEWTQILVIVNDNRYGGAGGSVAWTTTGGSWKNVALHEFGHAAFGLADEYDYYAGGDEEGQDNHPGPEPMQPNVTIEADPALVKWSSLVNAGSAVPTMNNPDCSTTNDGPSPVAANIVGTFEGADYYHCDAYRPQYSCKMRTTGADFCAVCIQTIRDTLSAYAAPATTGAITLDTPTVAFVDIPEGTSTVRPVVFSVDTCQPVTFEVSAAPGAPFSVAYEPVVVSNPAGGSARLARVWVRYECTASSGSAFDTISIRLVETGEEWDINLSGNCVPRETAAVQLVFDQSSSMLDMTSEGRLKKDVLKDSARVMADVAYEDTGLGVNTYDHDAHPSMEIQVAGPLLGGVGRTALRNAITNYEPNPSGMTATGDGIEFAKNKLDLATGYDNQAMIVLTDGKDTASKSVDEVDDGVINQTVFAIGMGTAEQINPVTLETLAGSTGGYMLMTGLLTQDDSFLLEKFYLQILAGVTNNDIILDPEGRLSPAAPTVAIPFDVAETDIEISVITLANLTGPVDMALQAPNGDIFGVSEAAVDPSIEYAKSNDSILIRSSLPLVSGGSPQREGRWHLLLKLDVKMFKKILGSIPDHIPDNLESSAVLQAYLELLTDLRNHGVKYSALVQTYSNLRMDVTLNQDSHEPGAKLLLDAVISEYGGPFRGSATVVADITLPNSTVTTVQLNHEGDGYYTATMIASNPGLYSARYRANGTTYRERPFTREQLRTASVWTGGDQPPQTTHPGGDGSKDPGSGGLVELLCCLYRHKGLSKVFFERLEKQGIDADVFRRCLKAYCKAKDKGETFRPEAIQQLSSAQLEVLQSQADELINSIHKLMS
ncbi:MAG: M64 family metallopeptidase [Candidatus Thiodiazotropha sp.]